MEKIDKEKFLTLAKKLIDSWGESAQNGEKRNFAFFVNDINQNISISDIRVIQHVDNLIFNDETEQLSEPLQELAHLVYKTADDLELADYVCNYGALFYDGRIGVQDFESATKYFQRASDLGNPKATENLGYVYYYGRLGEPDYVKAFKMFSKGSLVYNRACSTYKLGDMYLYGYFVTKDQSAAYSIYKRAESLVDNGKKENSAYLVSPDISYRLAECLRNGFGVEKNLQVAFAYYQYAELGYINKVQNGDFMVRKMLDKTIAAQNAVRIEILNSLPKLDWAKDLKGFDTK